MHNYESMKRMHGNPVSQTIDSPILIFDHFELQDAFSALAIILLFGVLFYEWGLMMLLLLFVLGAGPVIRKRHPRGIFFHWPYRILGVSLPGLVNPKRRQRFSD